MTPSYAIKKGVRYRYYVSCVLAQGRKGEAGSVCRIASDAIETVVMGAMANLPGTDARATRRDLPMPTGFGEKAHLDIDDITERQLDPARDRERVERFVERIMIRSQSVEISLAEGADLAAQSNLITIPWSRATFRRKRDVIQPTDGSSAAARPIRTEARTKLLAAIARGRSWLDEIVSRDASDIESIAAREGLSERSARMILSLAFLAPDIVKAAVNGTLPRGFGVSRLTDLPASWNEQRQTLGLATSF